ncbi:MAG TPA: MFS transporter [Candidatus Binataceae bacterium]|nr:MFS transporter [Candidatus Binataceae bacterium]
MAPKRTKWLVLGAVAFVQVFMFGPTVSTIGVLIPPLLREFHWTHAQVSRLVTAYELSLGCTSLFAGWLVDRMDARWVMGSGCLVAGTGCFLASRAHDLAFLIGCYALIGCGIGLASFITAVVVAIRWFPGRRALAASLASFGLGLGMFVAPRMVTEIVALASWRWGLMTIGTPMLALAAPVSFLLVRGNPNTASLASGQEMAGLEVGKALATSAFWMLFGLTLISEMGDGAVFFHLVAFLVGNGYSATTAATFFGGQALLLPICGVVWGALADRFGTRPILAVCFAFLGASVLTLLSASHAQAGVLPVAGWMVLWGIGMAHNGVISALIAEALGVRRYGTLSALIRSMVSVGQAVGPLIAGAIFDATGSYALGFKLAASAFFLSGVMAVLVVPAKGRDAIPKPAIAIAATS